MTGLRDAGYSPAVLARSEEVAPGLFEPLRLPLVHDALRRDGSPGALLATLFAYDGAVGQSQLRTAIGAELTARLTDAGLLDVVGDDVRAVGRLTPLGPRFVASDRPADGSDAVMPPGPSTVELAVLLHPSDSAADIGTGPGSLALLMAGSGDPVVATDCSPRACAFARANAHLNGVALDVREGDLLDPVAGERFALVVSQPPFVAHPDELDEVTYLHGGAYGDELSLRLLHGVPDALATDGVAVIRFDSTDDGRPPLAARALDPLAGRGVGAALLVRPGHSHDYGAVGYASVADPSFGPVYARTAVSYRRHDDSLGVLQHQRALAIVRAGAPWRAVVPVDRWPDSLGLMLAALDALSLPDQLLLHQRCRVPEGAHWLVKRPVHGEGDDRMALACVAPTLVHEWELTEAGMVVMEALAGGGTVAEAVQALADAARCETAELEADVCAAARASLARLVLVPVGNA
ncbi:MAG TPA: methyltransferase [Acidimicrobiales bacterium]